MAQIPGTLLAKAINPSYSIAAGALIWSISATCQAAAFNRAGLFVCRLGVGVGEAMFGVFAKLSQVGARPILTLLAQVKPWHSTCHFGIPKVTWPNESVYSSQQVRPTLQEILHPGTDNLPRRRLADPILVVGALSGAFGGLIAFGVTSIKHSSIKQYKILFLIEGELAFCPFHFPPMQSSPFRSLDKLSHPLGTTWYCSLVKLSLMNPLRMPERDLGNLRLPLYALNPSEESLPLRRRTYALSHATQRGVERRLQGSDQLEGCCRLFGGLEDLCHLHLVGRSLSLGV